MTDGLQDENTLDRHLRQGQVHTQVARAQRRDLQDRTVELVVAARELDEQAWQELQGSRVARVSLGRKRQGRKLDRQGLCETAARASLAADEPREVQQAAKRAQRLLQRAGELRWHVVVMHDGLARSWERKFARRGQDRAEIAQVARLGLYEAAKRYDPDRGVKFSTHAQWWIRARLMRELSGSALSHTKQEQLRNLHKLQQAHPGITDADAAQWLGLTLQALRKLQALEVTQNQVSLDTPQTESGDSLHEVISEDPSDEADGLDHQLLLRCVDQLPDFHQQVLTMRYGLTGETPITLAEAGGLLGYSREWIRRAEVDALCWLRLLMTGREFDVHVQDEEE